MADRVEHRARWAERVQGWKRSGLTQASFAEREGIAVAGVVRAVWRGAALAAAPSSDCGAVLRRGAGRGARCNWAAGAGASPRGGIVSPLRR